MTEIPQYFSSAAKILDSSRPADRFNEIQSDPMSDTIKYLLIISNET